MATRQADQPGRGNRVVEVDVVYPAADGSALNSVLYYPRSARGAAIVSVHGGTWVRGSARSNEAVSHLLASQGITVLSVGFRMPPAAGYPDSVSDVSCGIRWLHQRASRLGVSERTIGAIGYSSGAHQAVLCAMRPDDPRYGTRAPTYRGISGALSYVVSCYGVLSPRRRYDAAKRAGRADLVDGHDRYWPSLAAMTEGDPTLSLERGEPAQLPPLLALQGLTDANLGPSMAADLVRAWRRRGGEAELLELGEAPHGFLKAGPDTADGQAALDHVLGFIEARLAD